MAEREAERVRVVVIGLGWVGQAVADATLEDPRVELVGAADTDTSKSGRDVGEIIGKGRIGVQIEARVGPMLARCRPEVAIVCTTSDVGKFLRLAKVCVETGAHVVSTCENFAAPEHVSSAASRRLDALARDKGVAVLATGVNPGFVMDRLPALLTQATRSIRRVRVRRVVDAATRRAQLQAKVGVGLSVRQFEQRAKKGDIGHAGLRASLHLIGDSLGVRFDSVTETIEPVIAERATDSSVLGDVGKGKVRGLYQTARGEVGGYEFATLELVMALDELEPKDSIDIVGEPPVRFEGECAGDECTIATVLSAIPQVVSLPPGLRSVLDLGLQRPEVTLAVDWVRDPDAVETGRPVPSGSKKASARKKSAKKKSAKKKSAKKKSAKKKSAKKKSAKKKATKKKTTKKKTTKKKTTRKRSTKKRATKKRSRS